MADHSYRAGDEVLVDLHGTTKGLHEARGAVRYIGPPQDSNTGTATGGVLAIAIALYF